MPTVLLLPMIPRSMLIISRSFCFGWSLKEPAAETVHSICSCWRVSRWSSEITVVNFCLSSNG